MSPPTFCREGGQRLTAFLPPPPFGAFVFLAPKSSRGFQPGLASSSSSRAWRLVPGGEPGLLPGVGVPGTFVSSSGLRGAPGGPPVLSLGCRCRVRLDAEGQMGGPICQPCALALSASLVGPGAVDPV